MFLAEVIPISKNAPRGTLTYFTSKNIKTGDMVKVPLKNKVVPAIVFSVENVKNLKTSIKLSDFSLKKIISVLPNNPFLAEFIKSVQRFSDYSALLPGALFNSLIPSAILQNIESAEYIKPAESSKFKKINESFILQQDDEDRISIYKNIIREEFAKNSSVFFCVPTINDTENFIKILGKGIEENTYVFHGGISNKKILANWNIVAGKKHPVLIIATGKFLSIPRRDIGTIIIEKEKSPFYKQESRPHYDTRKFAEYIGKGLGAKIIFGDKVLRTETFWRYENGELLEVARPKLRYPKLLEEKIVDMTKQDKEEKGGFRIISKELENTIRELYLKKEKMFLLTARKGLHPLTMCDDCKNIIKCDKCKRPLVLYEKAGRRIFVCGLCGKETDAMIKCSNCSSWKLSAIGIGIDLVEKELRKKFPEIPVFKMDSDTTNTRKKAFQTMDLFLKSKTGILLSTEMGLNYIKDADNGAIISIDSLFAIPDFNMDEKIFWMIFDIKSIINKKIIVQTRNSDTRLINFALHGNVIEFYREEIKNREEFKYPPFVKFIKITFLGNKKSIENNVLHLKKTLEDKYSLNFYSSATKRNAGNAMHCLLEIPAKKWIDYDLLNRLRSLPPQFSVNVDPQGIF